MPANKMMAKIRAEAVLSVEVRRPTAHGGERRPGSLGAQTVVNRYGQLTAHFGGTAISTGKETEDLESTAEEEDGWKEANWGHLRLRT